METIKEEINRLRRNVLVHSCLYYEMDTCIISDSEFDKRAYRLRDLQNEYPEIAKQCVYAEAFKGFDGTTGYHLPLTDPWVVGAARRLLDYQKKRKGE